MLIQTNINQDSTGGNKASDLGGRKQVAEVHRGGKTLEKTKCEVLIVECEKSCLVLPSAEQEICGCERQEYAEESMKKTC